MNLGKTPRIVANKNQDNNKNVFTKPEKTFNNKQELQAYLVDSAMKNKLKSFNINVVLS